MAVHLPGLDRYVGQLGTPEVKDPITEPAESFLTRFVLPPGSAASKTGFRRLAAMLDAGAATRLIWWRRFHLLLKQDVTRPAILGLSMGK